MPKITPQPIDSKWSNLNSHTEGVFDPIKLQLTVKNVVKKVKQLVKKDPSIKAIAGCGNSGLMIIGIVSHLTGLAPIAVRKGVRSDSHADDRMVNGYVGGNYLIIDDLIDTGRTVNGMIEKIEGAWRCKSSRAWDESDKREKPQCKGIVLYDELGESYFNDKIKINTYGVKSLVRS